MTLNYKKGAFLPAFQIRLSEMLCRLMQSKLLSKNAKLEHVLEKRLVKSLEMRELNNIEKSISKALYCFLNDNETTRQIPFQNFDTNGLLGPH